MLDLNTLRLKNFIHELDAWTHAKGEPPKSQLNYILDGPGWTGQSDSPTTPFEQQSFTGAELDAYRVRTGRSFD